MKQKVRTKSNRSILKPDSKFKQSRVGKNQSTGLCGTITFNDVTKIHPALKTSLGYCLFKCTSIFKSRLEQSIQDLNLNTHHMALLAVLSNEKSINQNQLGDELGIDKASIVKLIDHLEKSKLVERVPSVEDRRVKFLHITPKGLSSLENARNVRESIENVYLSALSAKEKEMFRSILLKILEQKHET